LTISSLNELSHLLQMLLGESRVRPSLIARALASSHQPTLETALKLARRNPHLDFTEPVIPLLFDERPEIRRSALDILRFDPLLGLDTRRPFAYQAGASRSSAGSSSVEWYFSDARVEALSRRIQAKPRQQLGASLASLLELPGLGNLDPGGLFREGNESLREPFLEGLRRREQWRFPPQVGIVPSYACNLACDYCFTRGLEHEFLAEMSLQQLTRILDVVCGDSRMRKIGIFGGEPTRFPQILAFIDEIGRRERTFFFSTNGLADEQLFSEILRRKNLDMVNFHLTEQAEAPGAGRDRLLRNMEAAANRSCKIVLRYNLKDPRRTDWTFLAPYLKLLPDADFSFAVVFPSLKGDTVHVKTTALDGFAEKILRLVRYLKEISGKTKLVMAKPFPPCYFAPQDLRFLLANIEYHNICELGRAGGTNQIQVNPDLSVIPCMALSAEPFLVAEVRPVEQLAERFAEIIPALINTPALPCCADCALFLRGACQAVCYSYLGPSGSPANCNVPGVN